jgi:integrase
MRGDGSVFPRGNLLWIKFYRHGEPQREPAKYRDGRSIPATDPTAAQKFLRDRMKEIHAEECGGPAFTTARAKKLTVGDLLDGLKADYELRDKASPQALSYIELVRADLGDRLAAAIMPEAIDKYIQEKLAADYRPASVNRRLQVIGAAFNLAIRRGTLARGPFIRKLSEADNVRQGFFSEEEIADVLAALPDDGLRDFVEWASLTGQRKSEIASLTWSMVDGSVLRVSGTVTKNGRSRIIPLGAELAAIIERRKKARRVVSLDGSAQLSEPIFHRGDGELIKEFRKSWATATKKAKCPGRLFHDLRRTVARRLVAAAVPQVTARAFTGHLTDSVFARYAIVSSADLLAAQSKVAEFRKAVAK